MIRFNVQEIDGKYGIWYFLDDVPILVNPFGVFNELVNYDNFSSLMGETESSIKYPKIEYYALGIMLQVSDKKIVFKVVSLFNCDKVNTFAEKESAYIEHVNSILKSSGATKSVFEWFSSHYERYEIECIIDIDDFINQFMFALSELVKAIESGCETHYDNIVSDKTRLQRNLSSMFDCLLPLAGILKGKECVDVKDFNLEFIPWQICDCDLDYRVHIGGQLYESYMSDWTNDFDGFWSEVEELIEKKRDEATIKIYFENSPTIFRIVRIPSTSDNSEEVVRVTIYPNEFNKLATIFGYCELKQFLVSFYIGMLKSWACLDFINTQWDRFDDLSGYCKALISPKIVSFLRNNECD